MIFDPYTSDLRRPSPPPEMAIPLTHRAQPLSFLVLPAETRLRVYGYILPDPLAQPPVLVHVYCDDIKLVDRGCSGDEERAIIDTWSLLLTCSQTNLELVGLFYPKISFTFDTVSEAGFFFGLTRQSVRDLIRDVHLDMGLTDDSNSLAETLKLLPKLDALYMGSCERKTQDDHREVIWASMSLCYMSIVSQICPRLGTCLEDTRRGDVPRHSATRWPVTLRFTDSEHFTSDVVANSAIVRKVNIAEEVNKWMARGARRKSDPLITLDEPTFGDYELS